MNYGHVSHLFSVDRELCRDYILEKCSMAYPNPAEKSRVPVTKLSSEREQGEIEPLTVTPEMIEAAANVVLTKYGDDGNGYTSSMSWARDIATDALHAALSVLQAPPDKRAQ